MNFDFNIDNLSISTPWGQSSLGDVKNLSPLSQSSVEDWFKNKDFFRSMEWKEKSPLNGYFVGVLADVKVFNANSWLPKNVKDAFEWEYNLKEDTAFVPSLVVAVDKASLDRRIAETATIDEFDYVNAWIDFIINAVLYKPGLKYSTPGQALVKRRRSQNLLLPEFNSPMLLPEDEASSHLHMVKVTGPLSKFRSGLTLKIIGDPNVTVRLGEPIEGLGLNTHPL